MKKVLKWIGIVIGGLLGLLVVVIVGLAIYANINFRRVVERPIYEITADSSPEGIAHGEYLVRDVIGCQGCHGAIESEDEEPERDAPLIGNAIEVSEGPMQALFAPSNLTPDVETGLGAWSDAEIARAIREGIDKNNESLVIMPSYAFHNLSDADVAAIVGYLRSLEPVSNPIPDVELNLVGKIAFTTGFVGPASPTEPITEAVMTPEKGTVEYGDYFVNSLGLCTICHGENLAGGEVPFAEPDTPRALNLTPAGELQGWTEADFITAVRTGVTPTGRELHEAMPRLEKVTDEDLQAVFLYLQSIPAAQPED